MDRQDLIKPQDVRQMFESISTEPVKVQGSLTGGASTRLARYALAGGFKSAAIAALHVLEEYVRSDEFKEKLEAEETEYLLSQLKTEVSPDE